MKSMKSLILFLLTLVQTLDCLKSSELIQLNRDQMLQRNEMLFRFTKAIGVPTLWTMGGGYGEHSYETYVDFFKRISVEVREADTYK